MLEPSQQRVVEEHVALKEKVGKMQSFMLQQPAVELPVAECKRLGRQLDAMSDYLDVLEERIEAFNV